MPQPGSRNLNTSVGDKSHIYGTRSVTSVNLFVSIFSRKEPLRFWSCIQPKKKQFKVQIIGILEEIDSFYWPKMHLWKGAKKFGQGPPSFGQNPKEQQFSLVNSSLMYFSFKEFQLEPRETVALMGAHTLGQVKFWLLLYFQCVICYCVSDKDTDTPSETLREGKKLFFLEGAYEGIWTERGANVFNNQYYKVM